MKGKLTTNIKLCLLFDHSVEHQKIVDANRAQYENALKLRRERFIEDLDGYYKQVEEFHSFGEMNDVQRYLKKAQALQSRLDMAAEKVCLTAIYFPYNFIEIAINHL